MTTLPPADGPTAPTPAGALGPDASAWRPTPSLLRALVGGLLLCGVAVVAGSPALLVLGVPLLVSGLWSLAERPTPACLARAAARLRTCSAKARPVGSSHGSSCHVGPMRCG